MGGGDCFHYFRLDLSSGGFEMCPPVLRGKPPPPPPPIQTSPAAVCKNYIVSHLDVVQLNVLEQSSRSLWKHYFTGVRPTLFKKTKVSPLWFSAEELAAARRGGAAARRRRGGGGSLHNRRETFPLRRWSLKSFTCIFFFWVHRI